MQIDDMPPIIASGIMGTDIGDVTSPSPMMMPSDSASSKPIKDLDSRRALLTPCTLMAHDMQANLSIISPAPTIGAEFQLRSISMGDNTSGSNLKPRFIFEADATNPGGGVNVTPGITSKARGRCSSTKSSSLSSDRMGIFNPVIDSGTPVAINQRLSTTSSRGIGCEPSSDSSSIGSSRISSEDEGQRRHSRYKRFDNDSSSCPASLCGLADISNSVVKTTTPRAPIARRLSSKNSDNQARLKSAQLQAELQNADRMHNTILQKNVNQNPVMPQESKGRTSPSTPSTANKRTGSFKRIRESDPFTLNSISTYPSDPTQAVSGSRPRSYSTLAIGRSQAGVRLGEGRTNPDLSTPPETAHAPIYEEIEVFNDNDAVMYSQLTKRTKRANSVAPAPLARKNSCKPKPKFNCRPDRSNSADIFSQKKTENCKYNILPDGLDVRGDRLAKCAFPTTNTVHIKGNHIRLISHETLHNAIQGSYDSEFDNIVIIDARFPYEFDGGHIKGARNYWCTQQVTQNILSMDKLDTVNLSKGERTAIVFHCEFSSHRAPTMYKYLRTLDHHISLSQYPRLMLPEMYVLENGYKEFYENHPEDTEDHQGNPNYQPMKDRRFKTEEDRYEGRMNASYERASEDKWKQDGTIMELEQIVKKCGIKNIEGEYSKLQLMESSKSPSTPKRLQSL